MDRKTKKAVNVKILQSWYVVDSILFNDHARNVIAEGSVFKEYTALKASMLSNLFEYWDHVAYTPVTTDTVSTVKQLQESAVAHAKHGKSLASELMNKDSVKGKIKNQVMTEAKKNPSVDVKVFNDKIVRERFVQFSLDNCLIGLPLLEAKNIKDRCDFSCQILENAHKMMRDNLILMAETCKKTSTKI